jgi:flagellar basal-body rod modification protein FlgD
MMIHAVPREVGTQIAQAASSGNSSSGASGTNSTDSTQNMFMQLLTTQLQNQSPLDPDQMTTELVQFNMLDQLTQINQTLSGAFSSSTQSGSTGNSGAQTNSIQGGI